MSGNKKRGNYIRHITTILNRFPLIFFNHKGQKTIFVPLVVAIKPTPRPRRNSLNIVPIPTSKQQCEVFHMKKMISIS
jgi:hypothetical protein